MRLNQHDYSMCFLAGHSFAKRDHVQRFNLERYVKNLMTMIEWKIKLQRVFFLAIAKMVWQNEKNATTKTKSTHWIKYAHKKQQSNDSFKSNDLRIEPDCLVVQHVVMVLCLSQSLSAHWAERYKWVLVSFTMLCM